MKLSDIKAAYLEAGGTPEEGAARKVAQAEVVKPLSQLDLAKIGINALIDEATGYQNVRPVDDLRRMAGLPVLPIPGGPVRAALTPSPTPAPRAFKVGDKVTWKSGNGWGQTRKIGVVIGVLPAGKYPHECGFKGFDKRCLPRNTEHYVVKVGDKSYWPRVEFLTLVSPEDAPAERTGP